MKEKAENYKGIEFIRISKLPAEQRDALASSISREMIIKILMEKELVIDCVQYKDYTAWYDAHYAIGEKSGLVTVASASKGKVSAIKIALNN